MLTKTRHLYVSKAILMLTLAMRMICREDGELLQARKYLILSEIYRGIDKSLGRSGRKQATATEDFEFHSFSILSDVRSKASSKTMLPYSAI